LVVGSGPDEVAPPNRALPVLRDGSQDFLAGGSEGDRGAGGGHGGPKGEPRRPPLEPNPLHGQLAHACWASSLTANLCLPQVGQLKRGTLVFERIRSVHVPARICACSSRDIRGPDRASRSLVSRICRASGARPVPGHEKVLKKKLQYTLSGTVCDVFKGRTHHGALGLSLRFR
jgi:hypothetical protein